MNDGLPDLKKARRLDNPSVFFRSLSTMIGAGIQVHEALRLVADSSADPVTAAITERVAIGIVSGRSLSASLSEYPLIFSPYLVGLIRVGERTGALARILETLATHMERSEALRLKLRSAVTYPAVLICGSMTLLFVGPSFLLEGQLRMLEQSGQPLPPLTQAMITWTEICSSPITVVVAALGVAGVVFALRKEEVKEKLFMWLHQTPVISYFLRQAASARFARALEIALNSGLPIVQALPLCAQATGDPLLKVLIKVSVRELMRGDSVAESLRAIEFFPPVFHHLVQAGDETGKMPSMLALSAEFSEMELDLAINTASTLIEPVLLLVMGIFTALVLVATLQPTLALLQSL